MRKIIRIGICAIMIVSMLCIWPFCLVRKTEEVNSWLASQDYGITEQYLQQDTPYVQTFLAQESKIEWLEFKLYFEQDIHSLTGKLQFTLVDEKDEKVFEDSINVVDYNGYFWHVDIDKWVNKGENYRFIITVDEELENIFRGMYTIKAEEHAAGSVNLSLGDKMIAGQSFVKYGYAVPLNIKNVLCLWGFVLTIGMSFYCHVREESCLLIHPKMKKYWNCLWQLLKKYQLGILLGEICGILLLIIYICRNRAVDWDEAYSVMMITRLSLKEMIHTTALDMHPPLFYLLLRAFGVIFGTDVFTLKLMSVLVTGCSMMLGLTLIRKNWGAKVAFLYILIVGLGPQFIFNAVNIRMYELVLFFVTGSALFAYEIIQKRGKKQWLFFVLCSLGGVYTHYFAVVPLILIYGYLLIGLFWERRDDLKSFWFCCIGTIVGYAPWIYLFVTDRMKGVDALIGHLPWLTVVLKSFQQESNGENINFSKINLGELLTETFDTNIKYSVEMIIVLFIVAIVLFILNRKAFTRKEKLFLFMCAINMILSYIIIGLLASTNTHFITGRYVFAALGLIWLFMIVIVVRCGRVAVCAFVLNLTIYVLSAYTVHKSTELGTNTYLNDAYRVLEQVQQEEIIMYNFPTYHILYGVHLPEQDFVWIYDMDWENFEQDYIYFICWGGKWLTKEIQEKHQLEVINCGTMRFEEGLANVQLYKINILNHK